MAAVLIKFFSLGVKTMAKPLAKRFEVQYQGSAPPVHQATLLHTYRNM